MLLMTSFRTHASLQIENAMLRHQLNVYQRRQSRPKLRPMDRFLWAWISRVWPGWQETLMLVKPATVITWRRKRFRDYWAALSQYRRPGPPPVAKEVQELIRKLSGANIGWGVPRLIGELRKLGIHVAKSTVEKYRVKHPKSPSPTWKSFLANHITDLVAIDFFVVPPSTLKSCTFLSCLRTDDARCFASMSPTTRQPNGPHNKLQRPFPWDTAPAYLLRDHDAIYGDRFRRRVSSLLIKEVLTAPRSPWQNPYVERIIGSIRRDCLDHVIVFNERHLKRILSSYFDYYHPWRTHLGLAMDTPQGREIQIPDMGKVIEFADLGGLHHHYLRQAV